MKGTQSIIELTSTVLVVTDFSEASKEALRWAGHLAHDHNANLKVLYPYRLNQLKGKDDLGQARKNIEIEARNTFTQMAESVFKNGHTKYDFEAEVGFINDRIYSHTSKNEVLVIVISKGLANRNREAVNELLDHLRTPLLIVPSGDSTDM